MRHRSEHDEQGQALTRHETEGTSLDTLSALTTLTALRATQDLLPGKHRAPFAVPIPTQAIPTHDRVAATPPVKVVGKGRTVPDAGSLLTRTPAVARVERPATAKRTPAPIPHEAQWRASHLPRTIAASLLALSALGTAALGLQYAQARTSDGFVFLVVGVAVTVILWGVMIASTPQRVTLVGSVLTVHNTRGEERFDLVDALQPVDLVGEPGSSDWAVLLHRSNGTSVVLRRNEVSATELDPIVRFYREIATRRQAERDARFNL